MLRALGHAARRARLPRRYPPVPALRSLCTGEQVSFTFIENGEEIPVTAGVGRTILEAAHDNDIDLEGACDHSLACSTCHVILEQEIFDELGEVDDEEMDMLDLALGLEDTSRLGCQIKVSKLLEGTKITLPSESNNMS